MYSDINLIYKKLIIHYSCIVIMTLIAFSVYYCYEDMFPFNYLVIGCFIFNIFFLYLFYKLNFESLKSLIHTYFVLFTIILYPFVFVFWQEGSMTAFMWYLLIPLGIGLFFPFRTMIYWCIYVFVLIVSILVLTEFIFMNYNFTKKQLLVTHIITLFSSLCFVILILYYFNMLLLAKGNKRKENNIETNTNDKTEINSEKYLELYNTIVKYFENQKPYRNPDFNITQLAYELGTNVTYISKALNSNKNMNYNSFINTYRINEVKEMMEMNYHNKYTLKFIYTSAGFRHQSTFNKIFKLTEGVTPSDYIKEKYGSNIS